MTTKTLFFSTLLLGTFLSLFCLSATAPVMAMGDEEGVAVAAHAPLSPEQSANLSRKEKFISDAGGMLEFLPSTPEESARKKKILAQDKIALGYSYEELLELPATNPDVAKAKEKALSKLETIRKALELIEAKELMDSVTQQTNAIAAARGAPPARLDPNRPRFAIRMGEFL